MCTVVAKAYMRIAIAIEFAGVESIDLMDVSICYHMVQVRPYMVQTLSLTNARQSLQVVVSTLVVQPNQR